jgi:hypothetical protein
MELPETGEGIPSFSTSTCTLRQTLAHPQNGLPPANLITTLLTTLRRLDDFKLCIGDWVELDPVWPLLASMKYLKTLEVHHEREQAPFRSTLPLDERPAFPALKTLKVSLENFDSDDEIVDWCEERGIGYKAWG